ncbi:MAG: coenzyme F430 synthase [Methanobacteriaceae archaeon]|jgi:UDP-N-acetylmuramyl pentapeptide synthase|nr:coenzyme F430 synthase [Methanobacteriaceae archaeon]
MNIEVYDKCLVIDLTHGGINIASQISKKKLFKKVYAYDIYKTLNQQDINLLNYNNVEIIDDLSILEGDILIISPVHLSLSEDEIKEKINNKYNHYKFINHHEAVKLILEDYLKTNEDILNIEVTGVKGKTSSVFMLNEIFKDNNTLILTSIGAFLFKDKKRYLLKQDISITPANILNTINLAEKVTNPPCQVSKSCTIKGPEYKTSIIENSLGASGIGDIGLLTNIIENYKIANNKKDAKEAKKQIFNCKKVVIEYETLKKFYTDESLKYQSKINTFSLDKNNIEANLVLKGVKYNLEKSEIKIEYKDILTITNEKVSGSMKFQGFALGKHHVQNILGVVCTALCSNISEDVIKKGLNNFKGIPGRSSIKKVNGKNIIEEINPGINVESIKASVDMIKNLKNYTIMIGGKYGISCEEINEEKLANYLDKIAEKYDIILFGDLGKGVLKKMTKKLEFINSYMDIQKIAKDSKKNVLYIYRSNYKELSKR